VNTKDLRPFLSFVPTPMRPLGAALPALGLATAMSPWLPRGMDEPAAAPAVEHATVLEDARTQGRAEGLAETAKLRDRLSSVLSQLAAARAEVVAPSAEIIAEVATCVVETWIENTPRSQTFAPIVRGWLAQSSGQPATVRVHPDDAAALAEAIGDAPLTIATDPSLAPGALEIRGTALELSHDWRARLADLRAAIVAALSGVEP
jgi:flagellar biosynthesis/type III secretory pathway protein FliH